MHIRKYLIILCLVVPSLVCASHEGIKDLSEHQKNTKIIAELVDDALKMKPENADPVRYIAENISLVGQKALEKGFNPDAYTYEIIGGRASYTSVPLWEGKSIPFTLLVYIWPPEGKDATPIHSHPIPCALTVLKNSITQETFDKIDDGKVRFSKSKKLFEGDSEVDILLDSFIHRVSCREKGPQPAITLHLYAEGTAKKVKRTFYKAIPFHTYTE